MRCAAFFFRTRPQVSSANPADGVGELHRERLLVRLGLILVESLLLVGVVLCRFVGRLGDDEGRPAGIHDRSPVACGDPGGIRLRTVVRACR
jgi:hypothetical protein